MFRTRTTRTKNYLPLHSQAKEHHLTMVSLSYCLKSTRLSSGQDSDQGPNARKLGPSSTPTTEVHALPILGDREDRYRTEARVRPSRPKTVLIGPGRSHHTLPLILYCRAQVFSTSPDITVCTQLHHHAVLVTLRRLYKHTTTPLLSDSATMMGSPAPMSTRTELLLSPPACCRHC